MRNWIIILGIIILIAVVSVLILNFNEGDRVIYTDEKSNQIVNKNTLTMMYETEAGSGEYQVTSDTSWPQEGYIFNSNLSTCENDSILTWDDENKRVIVSTSVTDKCYVYFDKKPDIIYLADYIKSLYTEDGANGLYLHDGNGVYGNQEASDNSYRYTGANPNNYVCFGSNELTCPNDNIYRIIGVFENQVKLIKYDYAGESILGTAPIAMNGISGFSYYKGSLNALPYYYWADSIGSSSITWSESNLNIDILNGTYLGAMESEWIKKIANHKWVVTSNTYANIPQQSIKSAYTNEIESPVESASYSAKVGLMYVSDYGYAASPENWSTILYNYDNNKNRNNNWMFMGYYDWTITRRSDRAGQAFYINDIGNVVGNSVNRGVGVRPVFFLNSNVTYISGLGSLMDPFIIN